MIYTNNFLMIWVARECPTGLRLHFYSIKDWIRRVLPEYQCPLGLVLHFYSIGEFFGWLIKTRYQCPLGLKLHFYLDEIIENTNRKYVSMPSRADAPFLHTVNSWDYWKIYWVSMPFRAETPFLPLDTFATTMVAWYLYQCPFGLRLHFYSQ